MNIHAGRSMHLASIVLLRLGEGIEAQITFEEAERLAKRLLFLVEPPKPATTPKRPFSAILMERDQKIAELIAEIVKKNGEIAYLDRKVKMLKDVLDERQMKIDDLTVSVDFHNLGEKLKERECQLRSLQIQWECQRKTIESFQDREDALKEAMRIVIK